MNKQREQILQQEEKLFDFLYENQISKINQLLAKQENIRKEEVTLCLKEADYLSCLENTNQKYIEKEKLYKDYLNFFQDNINHCLGNCKNSLSKTVPQCYLQCLKFYTNFSNQINQSNWLNLFT